MKEWDDLVLETAERFGGTIPHPDTAATIATVYAKAPDAVTRTIDRIAGEYQDGNIRSPWGILKSRVQQIQVSVQTTSRANDRDKAIARAEQWIRTAGLHYDRPAEIADELFGHRGMLRTHRTPELEARVTALWASLRPLGELVEAEAIERGLRYQAQRATIDNMPNKPLDETELRALARTKAADTTRLA